MWFLYIMMGLALSSCLEGASEKGKTDTATPVQESDAQSSTPEVRVLLPRLATLNTLGVPKDDVIIHLQETSPACDQEKRELSAPFEENAELAIPLEKFCDVLIYITIGKPRYTTKRALGYRNEIEPWLAPTCYESCHNKAINPQTTTSDLTAHQSIVLKKRSIINHLKSGTMPPKIPVFPDTVEQVIQWLENGGSQEVLSEDSDLDTKNVAISERHLLLVHELKDSRTTPILLKPAYKLSTY